MEWVSPRTSIVNDATQWRLTSAEVIAAIVENIRMPLVPPSNFRNLVISSSLREGLKLAIFPERHMKSYLDRISRTQVYMPISKASNSNGASPLMLPSSCLLLDPYMPIKLLFRHCAIVDHLHSAGKACSFYHLVTVSNYRLLWNPVTSY